MAVTVYELIQELSKYNADDEVKFHAKAEYSVDTEAEFDRENENDTQEVTVNVEIDDDMEYDGVSQRYWDKDKVVIDIKY